LRSFLHGLGPTLLALRKLTDFSTACQVPQASGSRGQNHSKPIFEVGHLQYLMVIYGMLWDFMVILWDFMVIYGDFMVIHGILW